MLLHHNVASLPKQKIRDIAQSGRTVLFTSHDIDAVRRLCHGCIVLDHGALVHVGDTETAIRRYLEFAGMS